MPYDASDRKQVRKAEKLVKLAERNRASILVQLASTAAGREYLWNELSESHIFASTYSDNSQRMAFLEGQRSSGLRLLDAIMQSCPDQFIQAMREANGRRTVSDTIERNPDPGTDGERSSSPESGWDVEGFPSDAGDEVGTEG